MTKQAIPGLLGSAQSSVGHALGIAAMLVASTASAEGDSSTVEEMSIEALATVPVTSVTGRPQALHRSAASIYVISAEDIRRSAAQSLPEVLRLAPNLQVARLNASQWAITARGFNNAIGNKLLVLVDGRTIYSPLFSGVFWDAQEVMLEDIARIEVISGPGATLWGANAVNGVINVITKAATGTQGAHASAAADRSEHRVAARYGMPLGGDGAIRLYGLQSRRDETTAAGTSTPRGDEHRLNQVGFRADWRGDKTVALQGDAYEGGGDGVTNLAAKLSGANLLAKVSSAAAHANWQLQLYVDHAKRSDNVLFRDTTNTFDVTFNHSPSVATGHKVLWGIGHRTASSDTEPTAIVRFEPESRRLRWSHLFLQDEVALSDSLRATIGAKVETNVYTGAEVLPSVRLAYDAAENQLLWASVSRAVRSPARIDRDFYLPSVPPYLIEGGSSFRSETANVVELGVRGQRASASYSATAFLHEYDHLRAGRDAPTTVENRASGKIWGIELWGSVDVAPGWRLSGGLTELRKSLRKEAVAPESSLPNLGNDPRRHFQLRSSADITSRLQLDASVRYVASLPEPHVPSYTVGDVRVGWRLNEFVDASLYARNLGKRRHFEFNEADASFHHRTVGIRFDCRLP